MVAPEDIADLLLFLVSDRASTITEQVIAVDGGAGLGIVYGRVIFIHPPGAARASPARPSAEHQRR